MNINSPFCRGVLLRFHCNSKHMFILGIIMALAGAFLVGDWQSIRGDPCNQFDAINTTLCPDELALENMPLDTSITTERTDDSHFPVLVTPLDCTSCSEKTSCHELVSGHERHNLTLDHGPLFCTTTANESLIDCYLAQTHAILEAELSHEATQLGLILDMAPGINKEFLLHLADVRQLCPTLSLPLRSECFSLEGCSSGGSLSNPLCLTESENVDVLPCTANSSYVNSDCVCEQFSSVQGYSCFWNPVSRVTGQHCEHCREACLSSTYSLNFVQFCIGISLFVFGSASMRVTMTVIASDNFGQARQVSLLFFPLTTLLSLSSFFLSLSLFFSLSPSFQHE